MDSKSVRGYFAEYGSKYRGRGIFHHYPETKTIPAYMRTHFPEARYVLDLGFGTGLWFWASFLPSLERLDGIDAYPEALDEADRVFELSAVPEGFRMVHEQMGGRFTDHDLAWLKSTRGRFVFQDYRQPWPEEITRMQYDLVTEHGGGLGLMNSDSEVVETFQKAAAVLRPSGCLLFVNFVMEPSGADKKVGRVPVPGFCLSEELFRTAVDQAEMKMLDFHVIEKPHDMASVERFFYGYARK